MLRVILLDEAFYGKETVFLTKTMEVEREFLRIFSRDRNAFRDADCLALMQDIDSAKRQGDYGVVAPFGESSISCLSTGCKFGLIVLYYEKKGPAKLITEFGAAGDNVWEWLIRQDRGYQVFMCVETVYPGMTGWKNVEFVYKDQVYQGAMGEVYSFASHARWDSYDMTKEREKLAFLKREADYIIDTSMLLTRELRKELEKIFLQDARYKNMYVTVLSFGFKYGIPEDADLVFDVRFLPNPYYVDELRPQTGMDEGVYNYVMDNETARQFAQKLEDMVEFLIPNYAKEGKTSLVIAIGCTGGKHRSVTLARVLYNRLVEKREYGIRLEHRDIGKDALLKK